MFVCGKLGDVERADDEVDTPSMGPPVTMPSSPPALAMTVSRRPPI